MGYKREQFGGDYKRHIADNPELLGTPGGMGTSCAPQPLDTVAPLERIVRLVKTRVTWRFDGCQSKCQPIDPPLVRSAGVLTHLSGV